ncbi:MAG: PEP-CTERM sorting domain-containing protein [Akkermansiaceae bacterium]|nr:PEP-CTERM sorting domain-containing protein [Verrucomicrobiales bacterium]
MKLSRNSLSPFNQLLASALLVIGTVLPGQSATVLVSGTSQANDQPFIDFLNNNFQNVTVTYGNFSDYPANAATIATADVFFVGRSLSSGQYANAVNSASFNALTIPVVSMTSFVSRPDAGRWGWHSGGIAAAGLSVAGTETTVTAAGAGIFGVSAGAVDWFTVPAGNNFFSPGTGTVGNGQILATIGGDILAAGWNAGDQSGTGVTFGGDRLLFNLPQNGGMTVVPDTLAGQQALISALTAFTPLQVQVPEPGSMTLVALGGTALLVFRRRSNR